MDLSLHVDANDLISRNKRHCEHNQCNYAVHIIIESDYNNRIASSSADTTQPKSRVKRFCENNQCNFSFGIDPTTPRPYYPAVTYNNVVPVYDRGAAIGSYDTRPNDSIYYRENTPLKEEPGYIASVFISIKKFLFG